MAQDFRFTHFSSKRLCKELVCYVAEVDDGRSRHEYVRAVLWNSKYKCKPDILLVEISDTKSYAC